MKKRWAETARKQRTKKAEPKSKIKVDFEHCPTCRTMVPEDAIIECPACGYLGCPKCLPPTGVCPGCKLSEDEPDSEIKEMVESTAEDVGPFSTDDAAEEPGEPGLMCRRDDEEESEDFGEPGSLFTEENETEDEDEDEEDDDYN